jgi:hypothetical protein
MGRGYRSRKKGTRKRRKHVVIVCEGKKTETQHFNRFKERNSGVEIEPIYGECTDPKSIVQFAKKQIDKFDLNFEEGDGLWCVFDVDHVDKNKIEMIKYAVEFADKNNIRIALSNPCIELWFLLHYEWIYNPALTRDEAFDKLKEHIKDYDKNYPQIYSVLKDKDKLPTAIDNAKKLNGIHEKRNIELISVDSNPSSQVFKLIEFIRKTIQENRGSSVNLK